MFTWDVTIACNLVYNELSFIFTATFPIGSTGKMIMLC